MWVGIACGSTGGSFGFSLSEERANDISAKCTVKKKQTESGGEELMLQLKK